MTDIIDDDEEDAVATVQTMPKFFIQLLSLSFHRCESMCSMDHFLWTSGGGLIVLMVRHY